MKRHERQRKEQLEAHWLVTPVGTAQTIWSTGRTSETHSYPGRVEHGLDVPAEIMGLAGVSHVGGLGLRHRVENSAYVRAPIQVPAT